VFYYYTFCLENIDYHQSNDQVGTLGCLRNRYMWLGMMGMMAMALPQPVPFAPVSNPNLSLHPSIRHGWHKPWDKSVLQPLGYSVVAVVAVDTPSDHFLRPQKH
jgi:hypothetical protein